MLLAPTGAFAVSKEMQELQRDVAQLQDQVRTLQSGFDQRMAALQTLVQQALDAGNKANTNVSVLSASVTQTLERELKAGITPDQVMKRMDSGMPKLWVIYKALHLRRERPDWFGGQSDYAPLTVEGSKQPHLVAFRWGDSVAVLVPRWNVKLGAGFGSTTVELPGDRWTNLLAGEVVSGGKVRVQNLFRNFPVALLVKDTGGSDASI